MTLTTSVLIAVQLATSGWPSSFSAGNGFYVVPAFTTNVPCRLLMPFVSVLCCPIYRRRPTSVDFPTTWKSSGKTGPTVKDSEFSFTYLVCDDNSVSNVTYEKKTETWYFKTKS